jgi:hypothetical protein
MERAKATIPRREGFIPVSSQTASAGDGQGGGGAFLSHLTTAKQVAVSTQNQALNALVFLYREVLHQPFDQLGGWKSFQVRARRISRGCNDLLRPM